MGFIRANMIPLLKECSLKPFSGKLLLLGQGDIYFDMQHLRRMAKIANYTLDETIPFRPSHYGPFAQKGYPHSETVFRMLGFSSVSVLDYSDFEGAEIILDLNSAEIPVELEKQFDVIIDHGTLEHVFHLPNGLNNVFRMLKEGGRAVFSAPSGNFFDHGFYMLQPTLFMDWLTVNNWKVESIQVVQFTPNQETEPCFFADYEPGLFASVSYGGMDNKLYTTISIATKTDKTTGNIIPQQGVYARQTVWTGEDKMPKTDEPDLLNKIKGKLRYWINK